MKKIYIVVAILIALVGISLIPIKTVRIETKVETRTLPETDVNCRLSKYENVFQYVTNHTIIFENRMKEYLQTIYSDAQPNETGVCIEANVTDDEIIIYGYSTIRIYTQDRHSVDFICINRTNHTYELHTHPPGRCLPSPQDIFLTDEWLEENISLLICNANLSDIQIVSYSSIVQ